MFKVGDKVKFLNEKGGGIVTKIIGSNLVHVRIEDGFDIPVAATELIAVGSSGVAEKLFDPGYDIPEAPLPINEQQPEPEEKQTSRAFKGLQPAIFLAFVPNDQRILISGDVTLCLINNFPFTILFTLHLYDNISCFGQESGSISPHSVFEIGRFEREQCDHFFKGTLQVLLYFDEIRSLPAPLNADYKIRSSRLLHEDNYSHNTVFDGRAFFEKIADLPEELRTDETKTPGTPARKTSSAGLIEKFRIDEGFAEVDLHIEAIRDDHARLEPHEKLMYQMDFLKRCLESAIDKRYEKVIFIHGVGAGVLKSEIRKLLILYPEIQFYDASIAKYGIGATEVVIGKNRE